MERFGLVGVERERGGMGLLKLGMGDGGKLERGGRGRV